MTGIDLKSRRESIGLTAVELATILDINAYWLIALEDMAGEIPMSGLFDHALDSLESEYEAIQNKPAFEAKMEEVAAACERIDALLTKKGQTG